jgi:AcrR family transcriptional regulator
MEPRRSSGNVSTRERILALAEASVLEKGFAATSIEELISGAGITKSGFFYHFRDKGALAKCLLQRYLDREEAILDEIIARSEALHEDPLHSFLIALKMFAELMQDLPKTHPGCLVASFCYQENLFSAEVRELNRAGVLRWRRKFRGQIAKIAERYPPRLDVDLDALADMLSAVVDGGIIMSKVVQDKDVLPKQVLLFREFVRAIFSEPRAS